MRSSGCDLSRATSTGGTEAGQLGTGGAGRLRFACLVQSGRGQIGPGANCLTPPGPQGMIAGKVLLRVTKPSGVAPILERGVCVRKFCDGLFVSRLASFPTAPKFEGVLQWLLLEILCVSDNPP